jgi:tetratricopeptide (TPR) repeat protein
MKKSVDVFLGYALEDKDLCFEVLKQLKLLVREGLIHIWHEYTISPGVEREREILRYLEIAHVILLFVSIDFINSDFCYGVELRQAMERHERGEVRVIPIILRSVPWQETPLGKLQALPRGQMPIKNWPDQDTILTEIAEDVRTVVKELVSEHYLQEGHLLIEQKYYEQAIVNCEHALRLMPTSVTAHRLKGLALLELKKYEEALKAYDHVIHLGLRLASVYKERGDTLCSLRLYNDALASYNEATTLRPNFVEAYRGASASLRQLAKEHNRLAELCDEKVHEILNSERNTTQEALRWDQ